MQSRRSCPLYGTWGARSALIASQEPLFLRVKGYMSSEMNAGHVCSRAACMFSPVAMGANPTFKCHATGIIHACGSKCAHGGVIAKSGVLVCQLTGAVINNFVGSEEDAAPQGFGVGYQGGRHGPAKAKPCVAGVLGPRDGVTGRGCVTLVSKHFNRKRVYPADGEDEEEEKDKDKEGLSHGAGATALGGPGVTGPGAAEQTEEDDHGGEHVPGFRQVHRAPRKRTRPEAPRCSSGGTGSGEEPGGSSKPQELCTEHVRAKAAILNYLELITSPRVREAYRAQISNTVEELACAAAKRRSADCPGAVFEELLEQERTKIFWARGVGCPIPSRERVEALANFLTTNFMKYEAARAVHTSTPVKRKAGKAPAARALTPLKPIPSVDFALGFMLVMKEGLAGAFPPNPELAFVVKAIHASAMPTSSTRKMLPIEMAITNFIRRTPTAELHF